MPDNRRLPQIYIPPERGVGPGCFFLACIIIALTVGSIFVLVRTWW